MDDPCYNHWNQSRVKKSSTNCFTSMRTRIFANILCDFDEIVELKKRKRKHTYALLENEREVALVSNSEKLLYLNLSISSNIRNDPRLCILCIHYLNVCLLIIKPVDLLVTIALNPC